MTSLQGMLVGLVFLVAACAPPAATPPSATPTPVISKSREALAAEAFEASGMREKAEFAIRHSFKDFMGDARFAAVIDEELKTGLEPIKAEAVRIFAEEFSAQELADQVAFFNTPSGKAYLAKQAEVVDQIQPAVAREGQSILERIVKRVQGVSAPPEPTKKP